MALKKSCFNSAETTHIKRDHACDLAKKIMATVMRYRRIAGNIKSCMRRNCEACIAPHLPQVMAAINAQQPITFVLPAFPAKSPNPLKVLGTLPDMAEQLSLQFLNQLCQQIQTLYAPGARIILCSDGRVFNDVIGMRDIDVTQYHDALLGMIKSMSLTAISTFNLDDVYRELNFNQMREQLMMHYGESLESLKEAVRRGSKADRNKEDEEVHRQYCGITRFLLEDAQHPMQTQSRTALQKTCRQHAYIVIQRSRAWSDLVEARYPDAVRLSIHPQTCGAEKFGIHLMEAENWMTPWHGVAVKMNERFVLLKRAQAEKLGAQLIYHDDRPSHYELHENMKVLEGV